MPVRSKAFPSGLLSSELQAEPDSPRARWLILMSPGICIPVRIRAGCPCYVRFVSGPLASSVWAAYPKYLSIPRAVFSMFLGTSQERQIYQVIN